MRTPILVTGSHRSGTTWTGEMLSLSGEAGYIHEPFNPRRRPGWSGNRIPYWFLHVTDDNESYYAPVVQDVLAFRYPFTSNLRELRGPREIALFCSDVSRSALYRARGLRALLKDPIALFSAEWLARRFDMQVVVMIRHPAAFASSVKRLDWRFRFRSWLAQEALINGYLAPYRDEIHDHWARDPDVIDQAILMWNAMHHVITVYRERYPDWRFVRHEDLSREPVARFAELYDALGLRWSNRVAGKVARHSAPSNPEELPWRRHTTTRRDSRAAATAWRERLSDHEVARVIEGTRAIASRFYPDELG